MTDYDPQMVESEHTLLFPFPTGVIEKVRHAGIRQIVLRRGIL